MNNNTDLRFAVLIDADNVPSGSVKEMLEEIAKYGTPTFKRIYGDWTKPHITGWKNVLLENAITPIQQYSYTTGKNATDSAMIIDAMDILYTGRVDGFCIISSDSDFTRLALRLREAGMKVIGMGQKKTPSPFIAACDKFIYIEILRDRNAEEGIKETGDKKEETPSEESTEETIRKIDMKTINLISSSINDVADESGWAFLGDVGSLIIKKQPDFDPRNYGFKKLTQLIRNVSVFEVDERQTDRANIKHVYIKTKPKAKKATVKKTPEKK
jgi:uncharacterized LabA/DUF88 family protein/Fe-S-cluster formation regulator IscX/YfhJ